MILEMIRHFQEIEKVWNFFMRFRSPSIPPNIFYSNGWLVGVPNKALKVFHWKSSPSGTPVTMHLIGMPRVKEGTGTFFKG